MDWTVGSTVHPFLMVKICGPLIKGLRWPHEPCHHTSVGPTQIFLSPWSHTQLGLTARCAWRAPCTPCVNDKPWFMCVYYFLLKERQRAGAENDKLVPALSLSHFLWSAILPLKVSMKGFFSPTSPSLLDLVVSLIYIVTPFSISLSF